jgi:lysophospholipase L1-like esterase
MKKPAILFYLLLAILSASAAENRTSPTPADPSLTPAQDVAGLPRALIIGDSISMGYTQPVRRLLGDKANVHRPPTNCSSTSNGLNHLKSWLGDQRWDVIHFNFGLHDAKLPPEGIRHAPPEIYEKNLRELVRQMQATGARLIFATTTPVPNNGVISPTRRFGNIESYNNAALKVMKEAGVVVNDLNGFITPQIATLQKPNDVHFTEAGSARLAEQVAAALEMALKP